MNATLRGVLIGLLASAIPLGLSIFLFIRYDNAVENTQVSGVATIERGVNGGLVLDLQFRVSGHNRCENATEHWAARPQSWLTAQGIKEPIRRPIAATFNGVAPPDGRSPYHVRFDLPANIEPGPWDYEAQAFYRCQYLGVLTRSVQRVYGPVGFEVP